MLFFCLITGLPDVHFPWDIFTQTSLSGHPSYMLKSLNLLNMAVLTTLGALY